MLPASTDTPVRTDRPSPAPTVSLVSWVSLVLSVGVAALASVLLIRSMFTGYDLTDEGFYLYAADPSNRTNIANGLWGMYIGLVYQAVGYSLVGFRIAGVVLLAACFFQPVRSVL